MGNSKGLTFGIQSQLSLAMADGTIPKDLQEAQKGLNQFMIAENSKTKAVIWNIQEQMTLVSYEMMEHINGDKEKGAADARSILSDPPPDLRSKWVSYLAQSSDRGRPPSYLQPIQVYNPVHTDEFPKFDGTYPRAWMLRCNEYFKHVPSVLEEQKVTYAVRHFEGRAALWYDTFSSKNLDISWQQFVEIVAARFELLQEVQIVEDFCKLRMTGSYLDYVDQFEELMECVLVLNGNTLSESYYIESFLSGLSDELKSAIKIFKPTTLQGAIDVGRDQSTIIDATPRRIRSFVPINTVPPVRNVTQNSQNYLRAIPKTPTKWLTQAEFSARRERRLCYNCDEKFTPGHRCVIRKNFMLMTEDEELEHTKIMTSLDEEDTPDIPMKEVEVSLNAINGGDGITTNISTGICRGQKLQILLETGRTSSSTGESSTERLNSSTTNGQRLIRPKMVTDSTWEIQVHKLSHLLRLPQQEGSDIIRNDGLRARIPVKLDYDNLVVTGKLNGKKVDENFSITKLPRVDYHIPFRKGLENRAIDALSRVHNGFAICAAIIPLTLGWIEEVLDSYEGDELIAKLMIEEKTNADAPPLHLDIGLFMKYKNSFLVRQQQGIRNKFLQLMHNALNGGQTGVHGLPMSARKDMISFVIDKLINSGHYIWLSDLLTSQTLAKLLSDNIYRLCRLLVSLVVGRDVKVFAEKFRRDQLMILGELGFTFNLPAAHHSQSAKQTESLNQSLENYLKCLTSDATKHWFPWLFLAEDWYNASYPTTLKSTPFQELYDYALPCLSLKSYGDLTTGDIRDLVLEKGIMMQCLKEYLGKTQNDMKMLADRSRIDREFELGDHVYLKLQSYKQNSILLRCHSKMSISYNGPYIDTQVISAGVVYTSQLRDRAFDELSHISLSRVLNLEVINYGSYAVLQLLFHWDSENSDLASGEDEKYIVKVPFDFDPWGQGSLNGRGIVMGMAEENRRLEEASPELDGEVGGCANIVFLGRMGESGIELKNGMIKNKSG